MLPVTLDPIMLMTAAMPSVKSKMDGIVTEAHLQDLILATKSVEMENFSTSKTPPCVMMETQSTTMAVPPLVMLSQDTNAPVETMTMRVSAQKFVAMDRSLQMRSNVTMEIQCLEMVAAPLV
jgi:hypothetical protein